MQSYKKNRKLQAALPPKGERRRAAGVWGRGEAGWVVPSDES